MGIFAFYYYTFILVVAFFDQEKIFVHVDCLAVFPIGLFFYRTPGQVNQEGL